MKKKILFFVFHLVIVSSIFSQKISCLVLDMETRQPISFANVVYMKKNIGTISNELGRFFMPECYDCGESIKISCIGYESKLLDIDLMMGNDTIVLQRKEILLDEISVSPLKSIQILQFAHDKIVNKETILNSEIIIKQSKKVLDSTLLLIVGEGVLSFYDNNKYFYLKQNYFFQTKDNFNLQEKFISNPYIKNAIDNLDIKNTMKWLIYNSSLCKISNYKIIEFDNEEVYEIEVLYKAKDENTLLTLYIGRINYNVVRIDISRLIRNKKTIIESSGKILYRHYENAVYPSLLQTKIIYKDTKQNTENFEDVIDVIFINHQYLDINTFFLDYMEINQKIPLYYQINEQYNTNYSYLLSKDEEIFIKK